MYMCLYRLKLFVNTSFINYLEKCKQTYNIEKKYSNVLMTLLTLCMCHLIVMETLSFSTKIGSLTCVVPLKGV